MNLNILADAFDAAAAVCRAGAGEHTPALKRETKVVTKRATKAVEVDETDDVDVDEESEETDEDESGLTHEDVMLAAKKFVKKWDDVKKGRNEVKKVLKKFGVEKTTDLDEADLEKAIKLLK